jgi:myo-inositol-1(or 4)-monophosphatase
MSSRDPSVQFAHKLQVCQLAAAAGGAELLHWRGKFNFREKGVHDLVTDADLASEQAIRGILSKHFPEHAFLGEESAVGDPLAQPACWVVDPLDGTTNYVHDFPCFAVSVALVEEGEIVVAVVLDPLRDECFAAVRGLGATLNGVPLQVSPCDRVDHSLLAISLPPQLTPDAPDLMSFLAVAPRCRAIRRTGSAALNLAYVACGRLDGHWAHHIHPWDAAAGVLLIREAGGVVSACDGGPYDLAAANYLTAATPQLHQSLTSLINPRPA